MQIKGVPFAFIYVYSTIQYVHSRCLSVGAGVRCPGFPKIARNYGTTSLFERAHHVERISKNLLARKSVGRWW